MRRNLLRIFWGIVLILGGGLLLAENLGYIGGFSSQSWVYFLAGLSVLFFASYFISGLSHWGWLFPACILGGAAVTVWLSDSGVRASLLAAPVLLGVAVPFLAAFVLDVRKNWWALIPASLVGGSALITAFADQPVIGEFFSMIAYVVALPFFIIFLTKPRERGWALIPGYVIAAVGTLPILADRISGELLFTCIFLIIALPFLVAFLIDRSRIWGGLVAFIMAAVGTVPFLASALPSPEAFASLVLLAVALPFWVVFIVSRRSWWSVIPAGILTSVSLMIYLIGNWELDEFGIAVLNGLMSLGIAATFFVVWLRRGISPVDWAKYPAVVFLGVGLFSIVLGSSFTLFWPFLLIGGGILVLFFSLRPRHA
ncbi:MAG: hypothetical protein R3335_13705 [Anaerolineales bacterium]|nr:hypothetical protein [Anaerolineales bacterium]